MRHGRFTKRIVTKMPSMTFCAYKHSVPATGAQINVELYDLTSPSLLKCDLQYLNLTGIENVSISLICPLHDQQWASCQIREIAGCACAGYVGTHQLQRKPLASDSGIHRGTCVTHVPWCMSGSLTRDGGENASWIWFCTVCLHLWSSVCVCLLIYVCTFYFLYSSCHSLS